MPRADQISSASVRGKAALLPHSATRDPCAHRRARSGPGAPPRPTRHGRARDPPEHGRYRKLRSQPLAPKEPGCKRAAVAEIVDETLARVADRAQVDLVGTVAAIIRLAVIAEMLGIPREDWQH